MPPHGSRFHRLSEHFGGCCPWDASIWIQQRGLVRELYECRCQGMSTKIGSGFGFLCRGVLAGALLSHAAQAAQIEILQARFGDLSVNNSALLCDATATVRALCDGKANCLVQAAPVLCRGGSPGSPSAKLTINYACTPERISDIEIASMGNNAALRCVGAVQSVPTEPTAVSAAPESIGRVVSLRPLQATRSVVLPERRSLLVHRVPTPRTVQRAPTQRIAQTLPTRSPMAPHIPAAKPPTHPRAIK